MDKVYGGFAKTESGEETLLFETEISEHLARSRAFEKAQTRNECYGAGYQLDDIPVKTRETLCLSSEWNQKLTPEVALGKLLATFPKTVFTLYDVGVFIEEEFTSLATCTSLPYAKTIVKILEDAGWENIEIKEKKQSFNSVTLDNTTVYCLAIEEPVKASDCRGTPVRGLSALKHYL